MTQWEYYIDDLRTNNPMRHIELFQERGLDRWELVAVTNVSGYGMLYWKRPLSATTGQGTELLQK